MAWIEYCDVCGKVRGKAEAELYTLGLGFVRKPEPVQKFPFDEYQVCGPCVAWMTQALDDLLRQYVVARRPHSCRAPTITEAQEEPTEQLPPEKEKERCEPF